MAERKVTLSLTGAERERLAKLGVEADERGVLRSAAGREVAPGVAAALLRPGPPPSPGGFGRGQLREGHAAASPAEWTTGIPASLGGERMEPGRFQRGYLADGHQAERAHGIGGVPAIERGAQPRPEETRKTATPDPEDFDRGYLRAGHQAERPAGDPRVPASWPVAGADFGRGPLRWGEQLPSPGDRGGNNPLPGGAAGADVYAAAARAYGHNQEQARGEHVTPTGSLSAGAAPTASWAAPPVMRAASIPRAVQIEATRPAPGER